MADHYEDLTESEKAYWDIYTRLRELSDWDQFSDGQADRQGDARAWLVAQRKFIWSCANGKETPDYKPGWDIHQRSERYAQLADDKLNTGTCRRTCQLPTNAGTPQEKVFISEREMWWRVSSVDNDTQTWRQANADWLTQRRKKVWHLGENEGWNKADRKTRYNNLCIATKTGSAYDDWAKTHNTTTGEQKSSGGSSRSQAVSKARAYVGVNEQPSGSNRGTPQPSEWQRRVFGSSGVPWCACFTTCMAWDVGVKGTSSAAVTQIVSLAQAHQGMFRGWTTDPSQVLKGDMAIIGCTSCHVGVVASSEDACHTIEGNTSPSGGGSQYNGGCVAEKHRRRSEIIGWALVDYP